MKPSYNSIEVIELTTGNKLRIKESWFDPKLYRKPEEIISEEIKLEYIEEVEAPEVELEPKKTKKSKK